MMTSALALSQILSLVSEKNTDEPFLTATAERLGLSGPDAEIDVLRQLVRLTHQIDADIDALTLDPITTATLKKNAAPFNGIKKLTQVHQNIKQAKSNFLRPEHLVGLNRLHAAFVHARPAPELSQDARHLAHDFKQALEKLQASSVPHDLKDDLALHLRHIIAALENYYFFSEKHLDHSLEALVGTLVLNPDEAEKHVKTLQPLQETLVTLLSVLERAGKYTTIARKLYENGKVFLDIGN